MRTLQTTSVWDVQSRLKQAKGFSTPLDREILFKRWRTNWKMVLGFLLFCRACFNFSPLMTWQTLESLYPMLNLVKSNSVHESIIPHKNISIQVFHQMTLTVPMPIHGHLNTQNQKYVFYLPKCFLFDKNWCPKVKTQLKFPVSQILNFPTYFGKLFVELCYSS